MDPLAHTLFGATMAEAGLKRKTALATATLIIGANIPDIDAITILVSSDHALWFRINWLRPDSIELIGVPIPIEETDPNVEAALNSPDIRGFRNWMCFPVYEVRRLDSNCPGSAICSP
jgi:hypothetical protein